jgi:hypothetical protein
MNKRCVFHDEVDSVKLVLSGRIEPFNLIHAMGYGLESDILGKLLILHHIRWGDFEYTDGQGDKNLIASTPSSIDHGIHEFGLFLQKNYTIDSSVSQSLSLELLSNTLHILLDTELAILVGNKEKETEQTFPLYRKLLAAMRYEMLLEDMDEEDLDQEDLDQEDLDQEDLDQGDLDQEDQENLDMYIDDNSDVDFIDKNDPRRHHWDDMPMPLSEILNDDNNLVRQYVVSQDISLNPVLERAGYIVSDDGGIDLDVSVEDMFLKIHMIQQQNEHLVFRLYNFIDSLPSSKHELLHDFFYSSPNQTEEKIPTFLNQIGYKHNQHKDTVGRIIQSRVQYRNQLTPQESQTSAPKPHLMPSITSKVRQKRIVTFLKKRLQEINLSVNETIFQGVVDNCFDISFDSEQVKTTFNTKRDRLYSLITLSGFKSWYEQRIRNGLVSLNTSYWSIIAPPPVANEDPIFPQQGTRSPPTNDLKSVSTLIPRSRPTNDLKSERFVNTLIPIMSPPTNDLQSDRLVTTRIPTTDDIKSERLFTHVSEIEKAIDELYRVDLRHVPSNVLQSFYDRINKCTRLLTNIPKRRIIL